MNLPRWARIAATVSMSLGVLMLAVLPVGAQSSGGIGGRPANPDPANPRSQSIFIFTLDKGATDEDVVLVTNNSNEDQTIELYAVDGVVTNTGAFTCKQESEARQDVGSWISLEQSSVQLAAGDKKEVKFTINVPDNADVGEHNGCIVFQTAEDPGETSGNVRIRTRQAMRVVATVPGDLHREISINKLDVTTEDNIQRYMLSLSNKGNVSADVDTKVYLKSLFGNVAYENGGGYPVLAGQKLDLNFTNEEAPFFGGWYYASAKISYDERAGTLGTSDSRNMITKESDRQLVFVAPTVAGIFTLILLASLVGGVIGYFLYRRHQRTAALRTWETYTVVEGDNIQTIASRYGIDWKKLAAYNNISAPYLVNPGTKLRVPAAKSNSKQNTDVS